MNASTRSRDAFATRSRRTLPAPFLLTRWVRAVFAALEAVESPEDVARRTGSMVFRVAS